MTRVSDPSIPAFAALRAAVRLFRHHSGFVAVVVLVLGIGTAAASTVFTVVDSVVLRPLPYREPARLVTIWHTNPEQPTDPGSAAMAGALLLVAALAACIPPAVRAMRVDPAEGLRAE